jgi:lipoate synthase
MADVQVCVECGVLVRAGARRCLACEVEASEREAMEIAEREALAEAARYMACLFCGATGSDCRCGSEVGDAQLRR